MRFQPSPKVPESPFYSSVNMVSATRYRSDWSCPPWWEPYLPDAVWAAGAGTASPPLWICFYYTRGQGEGLYIACRCVRTKNLPPKGQGEGSCTAYICL